MPVPGLPPLRCSRERDRLLSGSSHALRTTAPTPAIPFADLNGHDLQKKTLTVMRALKSVRVSGSVTEQGSRMELQLAMDSQGQCTGSMTLNGGTVKMISTRTSLLIKADESFYRAQASSDQPRGETDAAVALLADRWVKTTSKDPSVKKLADSCDLAKLLGSFKESPLARKGNESSMNGAPSMVLITPGAEGSLETWHIATRGKPYLLRTVAGGATPAEMELSGFDKPLTLDVPADADVIDAEKMGRRTGTA